MSKSNIQRVSPLPVPLSSVRLGAHDAADLRWLLLRDYEGDLGVKSNFGDMLERLSREVGGHADPDSWHVVPVHEVHYRRFVDMSESMLRAAGKLRNLVARWNALDREHQLVLRLAYGVTRRMLPEWGELGPLVLVLKSAHDAYHADRTNKGQKPLDSWLARLPARAAMASVCSRIRRDADSRLRDASVAWERTWVVTRPGGGARAA